MVGVVRRAATLAVVLAVATISCTSDQPETRPSPSAPTEYSIFMGAPSPDGRDLGFASYFPTALTIHAGDSVELYNRGGFQAEHTVTFGGGGIAPPPLVVVGRLNPLVADACAAPDAAGPCSVSGSWTLLPPYAGDGFWNTGIVYDYGRVEIATAASLAPGDYTFRCLIHPWMHGVLHVVSPNAPADDPATVHAEALRLSNAAVTDADVPPPPRLPSEVVAAGWSSGDVLVNRFAPRRLEIHAGDTVTWRISSLQDITFDPTDGVEHVTSGPRAPGSIDRLRFERPGVYRYHSTLHLGMTGVIVVRP
jgi:plastocyanin